MKRIKQHKKNKGRNPDSLCTEQDTKQFPELKGLTLRQAEALLKSQREKYEKLIKLVDGYKEELKLLPQRYEAGEITLDEFEAETKRLAKICAEINGVRTLQDGTHGLRTVL